jgi:glycosyltransferase involved in cell wall biosynthesis
MKICYLIHTFHHGGAEKLVYTLATRLAHRHDILVGALYEPRDRVQARAIMTELEEKGVRTFQVGKLPGRMRLKAVYRLIRVLRAERPDIVHTHTFLANFYGRIAASIAGIPIRIVTLHTGADEWKKGRAFWMERFVMPLASQYVAVSSVAAHYFSQKFGLSRPPVIIPNGIEIEKFQNVMLDKETYRRALGLHPEDIVLINVAHIYRAKGHECLLEAFREVRRAFPNAKLLIAGDFRDLQLTNKLRSMADSYGLSDSVRLLGNRTDIPELLAISDVFVFPSLYEAHPVALLEAMAAGLPVVASAIPAVEEMVLDGKEARLVSPGDAAALSSAICEVLTNRALARELVKRAKDKVREHYTIEATVEAHENMYRELAEKVKRR